MVIRPTVGLLLVAIFTGVVAEATAAVDPIDVLDEALELTEALDLDDPDRLSARLDIAALLAFAGHGERGRELLAKSQDILTVPALRQRWSEDLDGQNYLIWDCELRLVAAMVLCGDDHGAEAAIARAAVEDRGDELAAAASVVAFRASDLERGHRFARLAWEHYRNSPDPNSFPSWLLARAQAEAGRFVELEMLIDGLSEDDFTGQFLGLFAHALADVGEKEWSERITAELRDHLIVRNVHPILASFDYATLGGIALRRDDEEAAEVAFEQARASLGDENADFKASLAAKILLQLASYGGEVSLTALRSVSEALAQAEGVSLNWDLIEAAIASDHEDWALARSRELEDRAQRCRSLVEVAKCLLLREHDTAIAADD